MISFLILGILFLLCIIVVQIAKVSDLTRNIRGAEVMDRRNDDTQARWMLIFLVTFLVGCIGSAIYYKNSMLGYGPHQAASAHGGELDGLFNMTLFFTGIVFVITHIVLFWFAYKYKRQEGRVSTFFAHSTKLELIWTIAPAVVMVILVTQGLVAWNKIMPDVPPTEDVIEFEATGYQFAWDLRYPGPDGKLGTKNYQLINLANNPLGQDWTDTKNIDDQHVSEIVLPVNKKVRVRITAKDVLHNFYLPHFRLKMDAVPGMPTYFVFTPTTTTEEYRERLSQYPEWQGPADPEDPNGPRRWEVFNYELACAELCGRGHYSMKRLVKIVTEEEYEKWLSEQPSYYVQNVRGTDADPHIGKLLDYEIEARATELTEDFEAAIIKDNPGEDAIRLTNVFFETGSADLKADSQYELSSVADILREYSDINIEISGHTDSTGEAAANQILSEARATSVKNFIVSKGISSGRISTVGYGPDQPVDTNDTAEGRQNNRRIEMRITSQNI